jgi:hypothetical protein
MVPLPRSGPTSTDTRGGESVRDLRQSR